MRKVLEVVGIAALLLLIAETWLALHGPDRLPARIPTHFDIAGRPDGWGSPGSLWLLPIVGALLYLSIVIVSRFPQVFNYPVRVTPLNRAALEQLALSMIAWLKVEIVCLFAFIQHGAIAAVRQRGAGLSPVLVPIALASVFATTIWFFIAMRRAGRRGPARRTA
jgi:uncharacterized membrane protein